MTYTYDADLVSDLHKDCYGFRPSVYYMAEWEEESPAGKQAIWDGLLIDLDRAINREKLETTRSVEIFESMIANSILLGAADRDTAIRWLTQAEDFKHSQDVEQFVWSHGILFTHLGREIVKKVCEERSFYLFQPE
jgi:hypothetical protein